MRMSKKDFDTLHENLRIFMEEEEACGNLRIFRAVPEARL